MFYRFLIVPSVVIFQFTFFVKMMKLNNVFNIKLPTECKAYKITRGLKIHVLLSTEACDLLMV